MTQDDEMRLAVLGLGQAGLPTALGLAELGWPVVGFDPDLAKARQIARGEVPFHEPEVEIPLRHHLDTGLFTVENDLAAAIQDSNVVFLCVGTPQGNDGAADLSQIDSAAQGIASNLNGYKLIVQKSTAPVLTAQRIKQILLRHAATSDSGVDGALDEVDFDVAVNPEFLRAGFALHDFLNPARIVLGVESERAKKILLTIYQPLLDRMGTTAESFIVVTDVNTAEIIKHAANAFLATKVSFINMVADLCDATGANVDDVARSMGMDPRIAPHFLKAGIGYAGSCLPKDLRAFVRVAEEHGVDFSLLREVERVNVGRSERFVSKVRQAVRVLDSSTLAIWGLAFKPGTDDVLESPSLDITRRLLEKGAQLRLYDPQSTDKFQHHFPEDAPSLTYCASAEEAVDGAHALLILTDWPQFLEVDLADVRRRMAVPLVLDARNHLDAAHIRAQGFTYHGIGRPEAGAWSRTDTCVRE